MEYIVRVGLRWADGVRRWVGEEQEVEAEEKWEALVKAVGAVKGFEVPMSEYWKNSSIRKKNKTEVFNRRSNRRKDGG